MLFFYVRHGRPTYNPDALKPVGHRQAEAVAKRLALYGIDKVFASSSNRAIETSRPTCEICEREATILDWCNEGHAFHDTAIELPGGGCTWAFCNHDYKLKFIDPEVQRLGDEWYNHPFFSETRFKEGIQRVDRETDALFAGLGYRHDRARKVFIPEHPTDERIALFAHEGFGKMFLSSVLDVPYNLFCTRFELSYTGMTVIEFAVEDDIVVPRVLTHANDSHLYREGLPTHYQNRVRF